MYKLLIYGTIIVIYIGVFIFFKKEIIDKANSIYETLIILMLLVMIIIPIILYIIDGYNIPSRLELDKFVPLERWTEFVFDYGGIIGGSAVSGMILFTITIFQIKSQKEEEDKNRRINNMPFLDYNFNVFSQFDGTGAIDLSDDKSEPLLLSIYMKNIGMNRIRKCFINIGSELINNKNDNSRRGTSTRSLLQ